MPFMQSFFNAGSAFLCPICGLTIGTRAASMTKARGTIAAPSDHAGQVLESIEGDDPDSTRDSLPKAVPAHRRAERLERLGLFGHHGPRP